HLDGPQMEQAVSDFFTKDTNSRILAYTNQRVVAYNDHIREIREITSSYMLGERLINNNAIQFKNGMMSVEEEIEIVKLSDQTESVEISDDVFLEVRRDDLRTKFGGIYVDVPLPEDKDHFTALIKFYQKQKNWNRYFHLKNTYPDLRPRDAATVHKAQGSTY